MKSYPVVVFAFLACVGPASASATGDFLSNLTAEERAAAGLDALTGPQRVALNLLADRWAGLKSEPLVAAARERALAESKALQTRAGDRGPGFDLAEPGTEPIRTKIAGEFAGWETGSTFRMENGQVWAVEGRVARYEVSPRRSPRVDLKPDTAGVWHLHLVSEATNVRVQRVK